MDFSSGLCYNSRTKGVVGSEIVTGAPNSGSADREDPEGAAVVDASLHAMSRNGGVGLHELKIMMHGDFSVL